MTMVDLCWGWNVLSDRTVAPQPAALTAKWGWGSGRACNNAAAARGHRLAVRQAPTQGPKPQPAAPKVQPYLDFLVPLLLRAATFFFSSLYSSMPDREAWWARSRRSARASIWRTRSRVTCVYNTAGDAGQRQDHVENNQIEVESVHARVDGLAKPERCRKPALGRGSHVQAMQRTCACVQMPLATPRGSAHAVLSRGSCS